MHGNIYEWCAKWWNNDNDGNVRDFTNSQDNLINRDSNLIKIEKFFQDVLPYRSICHALRGGGYNSSSEECHSSHTRYQQSNGILGLEIGFRLIC